jgi:hypothetical protein
MDRRVAGWASPEVDMHLSDRLAPFPNASGRVYQLCIRPIGFSVPVVITPIPCIRERAGEPLSLGKMLIGH